MNYFRCAARIGGFALCLSACAGCEGTPKSVGFLSDYSRLTAEGSNLRYVDEGRLANYSSFVVDPVSVHFHEGAKGRDTDSATLRKFKTALRTAIVESLSSPYRVVSQPGPGVARIRVAITDVRKDTPALNVLPQTRLMGAGFGGAAMEGEVVDSQSGDQIAAVIQTQKGNALSLAGYSEWSSAETVLKDWAKKFRERLDKARAG